MSRIRQIKPSWFLDKQLRRGTTADAREFYIGLWMLADDAGYLVWDPERIAAELYPFDPERRRELRVARWADTLMTLDSDNPHLVIWDCGHAQVPKMPIHQRIAGTRSFTIQRVHVGDMGSPPDARCKAAKPLESLQVATRSHGIGRVGNGKERNGRVGVTARAREGGSFKDKAGWDG